MTRLGARVECQCGRDYYELLHATSVKYQQNNWLLDDLPRLVAAGGDAIIEIGCGNGLFLERASQHWPCVLGVDWVRSGSLDRVLAHNPNVRFVQHDITELEIAERFDLLVSADVLEHLSPSVLSPVIRRLDACARRCYHKIACYDDATVTCQCSVRGAGSGCSNKQREVAGTGLSGSNAAKDDRTNGSLSFRTWSLNEAWVHESRKCSTGEEPFPPAIPVVELDEILRIDLGVQELELYRALRVARGIEGESGDNRSEGGDGPGERGRRDMYFATSAKSYMSVGAPNLFSGLVGPRLGKATA